MESVLLYESGDPARALGSLQGFVMVLYGITEEELEGRLEQVKTLRMQVTA